MAKTKTANDEVLTRVKRMLLSRAESKNTVDALFEQASPARVKEVAKMDKLFRQSPANQTQAPNLQREEVAKNVSEYFEKKAYLSEAQRRYPELLKVGNTESQGQLAPGKKPAGKVPTRAIISGGQQ